MRLTATANFTTALQWIAPLIVAIVWILLVSLMKEPNRRYFMAILVAGAGAAYMSGGGFGLWEVAFCVVMAFHAYQGLWSYRFIGLAWLLHTGWDVLHHLDGNPMLPVDATSALRCAICDPVIAAWCFAGAPSLSELMGGERVQQVDLAELR